MSYRLNDPGGTRTTEEAKRNIAVRTKRENLSKPIIKADMEERWGKTVSVEDNGIDNSGEFIEDDRAVRGDPDWKIVYDGQEIQCEICVHSERYSTVSFKAQKLKNIAKNANSRIMVVRENYYLVLNSKGAEYLLAAYDVKCVQRIYGGKPSIILDRDEVNLLVKGGIFSRFDYTPNAQTVMAGLKNQLF